MSKMRILTLILVAAVCTIATRALPFLLFSGRKEIPPSIRYLGIVLPPAVISLLVIYCLRNISFLQSPHGLPELICVLVVAVLHWVKGNNLLSIGVGTILYMFLIQVVFV